jgi:phosphatidate phosphatase APP1
MGRSLTPFEDVNSSNGQNACDAAAGGAADAGGLRQGDDQVTPDLKEVESGELSHSSAVQMPTIPIRVHRARVPFETADAVQRWWRRKAGPLSLVARRVIALAFDLWMKVGTKAAQVCGWYPKVDSYAGYGTDDYVRLICRTLMAPRGSKSGAVLRGIHGMLAVPAPGERVRIAIDGLPAETVRIGDEVSGDGGVGSGDGGPYAVSDASGYLELVVERGLKPGKHRVQYAVDHRMPVNADFYVISPRTKVGIISDVDDTIMVTNAPSLLKAAYNFLLTNPRKRNAVPGMNALYAKLSDMLPDAPFFYLSTSPWNVESVIRHFIGEHGFPAGPLLLRDFDPNSRTFAPTAVAHKLEFAEQLMKDFPDMRFILIGDDGQQDPTTYATIARRHPGRVLAIAIRSLGPRETSPLSSMGFAATDPMPVVDVPVFTGATGANLMRTMLPYLRHVLQLD